MITRLLPLLLLLSLSPAALASSPPLESASLEDRLLRQPYDYETRQLLLHQYLENDNQARAYYHAAWLAWLAPPSFADPAAKLLAERAPRERASRAGAAPAPRRSPYKHSNASLISASKERSLNTFPSSVANLMNSSPAQKSPPAVAGAPIPFLASR